MRIERKAARLVLHHQRFWIPGSAARPRNDEEGLMIVERSRQALIEKSKQGIKTPQTEIDLIKRRLRGAEADYAAGKQQGL